MYQIARGADVRGWGTGMMQQLKFDTQTGQLLMQPGMMQQPAMIMQ